MVFQVGEMRQLDCRVSLEEMKSEMARWIRERGEGTIESGVIDIMEVIAVSPSMRTFFVS